MRKFMLSLRSNPYNPFSQYDLWKMFDTREGFDTAGLLARLVPTSESLSEELNDVAVERAIDNVIANPAFVGLYKKVEAPKT